MSNRPTNTDRGTRRWAPWWAYLAPILGIHYLRQWLLPYGTIPKTVDVLLAVALAAVMFLLITVAYRASRRR